MVISDSVITGMLFSLAASITLPLILLMILMLKAKPKGMLAFIMSGAISVIVGPIICGTIVGTMLKSAGVSSPMLISIITAIFLVAGLVVMIFYISPGGIDFKQIVVFGASASLIYSIFYNALGIIQNIMIVNYVKAGDVSELLGEDSDKTIKMWEETVANFKASEFFISGYLQIILIIFITAIVVVVVNGIINKKVVVYSMIAGGIYIVKEMGYMLLMDNVNSIVAAIYATLFVGVAGYYIYKEYKKNVCLLSQIEAAKLK